MNKSWVKRNTVTLAFIACAVVCTCEVIPKRTFDTLITFTTIKYLNLLKLIKTLMIRKLIFWYTISRLEGCTMCKLPPPPHILGKLSLIHTIFAQTAEYGQKCKSLATLYLAINLKLLRKSSKLRYKTTSAWASSSLCTSLPRPQFSLRAVKRGVKGFESCRVSLDFFLIVI